MKIYSWNVNGIRAVQKKGFIEWIKREQPDILCIQETKAHKEQLDNELTNIDGYRAYFNSAQRKGYSGVATYTKEEPRSVVHGIGIELYDTEGRVLITEYSRFTLLNVYFPNGKRDKSRLEYKLDFYDAILDFCDEQKSQGKKLIICGDYNTAHNAIDLKHPKANENVSGFLPEERAWMDKFVSHGYIDTFRYLHPDAVKYSWWSYRFKARERNIGWRLDYHFVSKNFIDEVADVKIFTDVMGSDHCPVGLYLKK